MQTISGAGGQIARELARELARTYGEEIRLVSRRPQKVNAGDSLYPADLLDARQTQEAINGSRIVYFTAGLPPDSALWERQFPLMLQNALDASRRAGAAFVYFDNTYMYPQNGSLQTEETPFAPVGRKGRVRAIMAKMVLDAMRSGDIPVLIGRAPEFYGPEKTQSFTNSLILDRLKAGKQPRIPLRDDRLRTLIWTPDAGRALALLGNTPDAYGRTWHLPCDDERYTYARLTALACEIAGRPVSWRVVSRLALTAAGLFSKGAREIRELLARYEHDNLFDSTAFKTRFPDFAVTRYRQGLEAIFHEG